MKAARQPDTRNSTAKTVCRLDPGHLSATCHSPDRIRCIAICRGNRRRRCCSPSVAGYVEAAIYVDRNGDEIRPAMLDTFLRQFSIRIEPVTVAQASLARQAFVLFRQRSTQSGFEFRGLFHLCTGSRLWRTSALQRKLPSHGPFARLSYSSSSASSPALAAFAAATTFSACSCGT